MDEQRDHVEEAANKAIDADEQETEVSVVSDTCDDCSEKVWYDANDPGSVYCDDEDLSVEHECEYGDDEYDEDEEEDEEDDDEIPPNAGSSI